MNARSEDRIEKVLQFLGQKGSYLILRELLQGPQRFGNLQSNTQLLPRTLSMRLKEMEAAGLVTRHRFAEVPPRVVYELTPEAERLKIVLDALEEWAKV
ncbi:winged helix-turn-helix transcriptional regulator [Oceanithermus sp.]